MYRGIINTVESDFRLQAQEPQLTMNSISTAPEKDCLYRFIFETTHIRGELVHLDDSWQSVLQRQHYPDPIRDLLGQTLAAAALLSATLKHDSTLIIQIQGKGPLSLLVVQAKNKTRLRGMAEWQGDFNAGSLEALCGEGHLTITIEPANGNERYQSIIALGKKSLSQALDNYFQQSEQLNTRIWLTANARCTAGLLLQELPADANTSNFDNSLTADKDAWNRIIHLSETLTDTELRELPVTDILNRLYHQEEVRLFDPQLLCFSCSCSRDLIANTLRNLGQQETIKIIEAEGKISVQCGFCKQNYDFDSIDCETLFIDNIKPHNNDKRH